jgi:hypothetical protein
VCAGSFSLDYLSLNFVLTAGGVSGFPRSDLRAGLRIELDFLCRDLFSCSRSRRPAAFPARATCSIFAFFRSVRRCKPSPGKSPPAPNSSWICLSVSCRFRFLLQRCRPASRIFRSSVGVRPGACCQFFLRFGFSLPPLKSGLILKLAVLRLEFFKFSSGSYDGFLVTHVRYLIKYV